MAVQRCVLYAMDQGLVLRQCPSFSITHTTVARTLHFGAVFDRSAAGSVFRNNSFASAASYHLVIFPATDLKTFDSDHNNLAAHIRADSASRPGPDETPLRGAGDFFASVQTKAIVTIPPDPSDRYGSLRAWQETTGQDRHSIFKHPRYVNPAQRDFRLSPRSPNVGAGEGGTDIGALGVGRD